MVSTTSRINSAFFWFKAKRVQIRFDFIYLLLKHADPCLKLGLLIFGELHTGLLVRLLLLQPFNCFIKLILSLNGSLR